MALVPRTRYPGQVSTIDPGYPQGKAQNIVVAGDGTGTPYEQDLVNDLFGLEQALLDAAKITPTGSPDKVGASQYLDAIRIIGRREIQKAQALNWPVGASFAASGSVDGGVGIGYAPDIGFSGGGIWVLQTIGTDLWTSEDGQLWTQRSTGLGAASFTNPWIAYGKINGASGFLLSQNSNPNVYYTSTDAITWSLINTTSTPVPANPVSAYSSSLGLWVMAGASGAISTSPTALANTWTARTTPTTWQSSSGGAKRIVWNGSLFVVLPAASPGGYTKCLTSADGITWTERSFGTNQIWVGLAYSTFEGCWMAVADSGAVVKSTDGLTWTIVSAGPGYGMKDLAALGSVWVAPTRSAAVGGIAFSTDVGVTWTPVNVGSHRVAVSGWNRILAGDNRFMVAHVVASGAAEIRLSQREL